MTYTGNYTGGDISSITIDLLGEILAQIGTFVTLIALFIIFKWAWQRTHPE